jgi:hypothetical protein
MALLRSASMNFTCEFCVWGRAAWRAAMHRFSHGPVNAWLLLDHGLTIDGWARLCHRC